MKLIEILKITDSALTIIIWKCGTNDTDPIYRGPVHNVPWSIAEMYLAKGLNGNKCMLSTRNAEDGKALLVVSVSEKETTTRRMKGFEI